MAIKGVRKGLWLNPLEFDSLQKLYYLRKGIYLSFRMFFAFLLSA